MIMHYTIFDYLILATFLISLSVYYQKPTPIYLKLFPVYLLSALIAELWMEWLSQQGRYNTGVANVWGIIEFCFYFFVLYEIIANKKIKRVILFISIAFACIGFFNLIFIQKKVGFNPVNFSLGCLITVSACIYYFVELFQKVEAPSLSRLPAFWICSGIFFNTILSFPTFALLSFMQQISRENKAARLLFQNIDSIFLITILLTFILYAIGILCRIRIRKSIL